MPDSLRSEMRLRRQIDRGSARDYRLGLTLITGSAVAWSTAGFFTRLIPLDVSTMLAWRGLFGAAGIAAAILATERRDAWRSVRAMSWVSWLFAIISAAAMILFLTSLRHTTVAHAAVIYATIPFLAAALSWLVMRERPTQGATLASIAALLGVALMVGFGVEGGGLGDVLAFAMTFCVACMMVITRRFPDIPVMPAACLSALLSGLICWPFGHPLAVTGHELLQLAAFGLVNSAVGLTLFTLGSRLLPAIETALIGSLDAPLAPLWVWIAFGESPSMITLIGGAVVFIAVATHTVTEAAKTPSRQDDREEGTQNNLDSRQ